MFVHTYSTCTRTPRWKHQFLPNHWDFNFCGSGQFRTWDCICAVIGTQGQIFYFRCNFLFYFHCKFVDLIQFDILSRLHSDCAGGSVGLSGGHPLIWPAAARVERPLLQLRRAQVVKPAALCFPGRLHGPRHDGPDCGREAEAAGAGGGEALEEPHTEDDQRWTKISERKEKQLCRVRRRLHVEQSSSSPSKPNRLIHQPPEPWSTNPEELTSPQGARMLLKSQELRY